MAKIQPISTFYNGETIELTNFVLKSIGDNMSLKPLKGIATLYYEFQSVAVNEDGSETYTNVITDTLDISGPDYDNWNNDPSSNAWAYNWAANKLNLNFVDGLTIIS
jgi:hypothetical protein